MFNSIKSGVYKYMDEGEYNLRDSRGEKLEAISVYMGRYPVPYVKQNYDLPPEVTKSLVDFLIEKFTKMDLVSALSWNLLIVGKIHKGYSSVKNAVYDVALSNENGNKFIIKNISFDENNLPKSDTIIFQ